MNWGPQPPPPNVGQPPGFSQQRYAPNAPAHPAYPQHAYPQQAYARPPQKKSNTGLIVGLVIGALFLGTCATGFVLAVGRGGGAGGSSHKSAPGVPSDKQDYIGSWVGKGITLRIDKDGSIHYKKRRGATSTSIEGNKIQRFEGDSFFVSLFVTNTKFDVSDPPKKGEHYWTMTVDGNELKRSVDDDRLVDSLANVQCKWNLPNV